MEEPARSSAWGKIPPFLKDAAVSSHHSPMNSSGGHLHRITPKPIDSDTAVEAIKKRKWSIGQNTTNAAHVTPNPHTTSPLLHDLGVTCLSQKKKKNRKLSLQDGETAASLVNVSVVQQPDEIFPKLDVSDPDSARRVQQRRRTIAMGKNTVGYDEYRKQVPMHQRKPRSMDHPATPDHTLDIPNRRWLGLVRAWRVALHQFDPAEMKDVHANKMSSEPLSSSSPMQVDSPMINQMSGQTKRTMLSVQEEEIERAMNQGLPVDFKSSLTFQTNGTMALVSQERSSQESKKGFRRVLFNDDEDDDEATRRKRGIFDNCPYKEKRKVEDELDRWEKCVPQQQEDDLLVDYGDSDDDELL